MEAIEELRINGVYHGNLTIHNIYHSRVGGAIVVKLVNFQNRGTFVSNPSLVVNSTILSCISVQLVLCNCRFIVFFSLFYNQNTFCQLVHTDRCENLSHNAICRIIRNIKMEVME